MLEFLEGKATERKLRLFAWACCFHPSLRRLLSHAAQALVEVTGRFADGQATWEEVLAAAQQAPQGKVRGGPSISWNPVHLPPLSQADRATRGLALENAGEAVWKVVREGGNLLGSAPCNLLRGIVGNPFRPGTFNPVWQTPEVVALSKAIYDERSFDRLPVLADVLEEAGCQAPQILGHCRQPGVHARGCWVLDLVLGRK